MSDTGPQGPVEMLASRWMIAVFAAVGLLFGLITYTVRDSVYAGETIVTFNDTAAATSDQVALIESDQILGPAASALGFTPDITVTAVTGVLTIRAEAPDPDAASTAANTVARLYADTQVGLAARIATPAEADPNPVAPNRLAHVLIGSLLGAAVGGLVTSAGVLGRLLPRRERRVEPERLAPIRPAVAPSADLHALVTGVETETDAAAMAHDQPDGADAVVANMPFRELLAPVESTSAPSLDADTVTPFSSAAASMLADPPPASSPWSDLDPEPDPADDLDWFDRQEPAATDDVGTLHLDDLELEEVDLDHRDRGTDDPQDRPFDDDPFLDLDLDMDDLDHEDGDHVIVDLTDAHGFGHVEAAEDLEDDVEDEADTVGYVEIAEIVQESPPPDNPTTSVEPHGGDRAVDSDRIDDLVAAHEAELRDRDLEHTQAVSVIEASYERKLAELKRQLADARKQGRMAASQLKRMSGDDQHRIGDLEAQAGALEAEIATLRSQLESERIAHLTELTGERDAADRALDNARRGFEDRLEAAAKDNRKTLAERRGELDEELAGLRAEHQRALDRQHTEYEGALTRERERHKSDLMRLSERHRTELAEARQHNDEEAARWTEKTKDTLADLRTTQRELAARVEELEQAERQYRAELTTARKLNEESRRKHEATEQVLRDELATATKALTTEKSRNAALREDVVRRTAEAHQAVDRVIEDRSAQLAELEALVNRQRAHAEERVREATAAGEERARDAARREAELSARITRLERELDQARGRTG